MVATQKQPETEPTLTRYTGCLLGGALGDALGWEVEFDSISDIYTKFGKQGILEPVANAQGRYEITDDTQMALFTAEGCLQAWASARHLGPPPDFQACLHQAYLRWLHTQGEEGIDQGGWLLKNPELYARRAPGATCLAALKEKRTGTVSTPLNTSKGCGGVMRAAPAGLLAARIIDGGDEDIARFAFELGSLAAALTHGHPSGYLSAGYLAALVSALCRGMQLEPAMDLVMSVLKTQRGSEETVAAIEKALCLSKNQSIKPSPEAIETLGSGWVGEEALAISLYCALTSQDDCVQGLRLAVNHSGDSDSTGAITGNILGALLGESALPVAWLQHLELSGVIWQMGEDLFTAFQGTNYWLKRYFVKTS